MTPNHRKHIYNKAKVNDFKGEAHSHNKVFAANEIIRCQVVIKKKSNIMTIVQ